LQSFPTIAQKVQSCDEEGISAKLPGLYHLSFACGQEVDRSRPETVSIGRQEPGGCAAVLWRRKKRKEMGGLLLPHHQTFPNSLQAAIPGSLSLHKGDRKNLHHLTVGRPDFAIFGAFMVKK
jgi:hypothetical protein